MLKKRGQIAVFVIIAIVLVASVLVVILFWDKVVSGGGGDEFEEVWSFYDDCIKAKTEYALSVAGTQGGYINVPEFQPGSEYAPFSSQLDFLGNPVPYWYYVSGNGVVREQVPQLSQISSQVEDFLEDELTYCDFTGLRKKGYVINVGSPKVDVNIQSERVNVEVSADLSVEFAGTKAVKRTHDVEVDSKFGKFYNLARAVYDKEKKEAFLENYTLDVLYNYAPVTGVEVSCEPEIWKAREVVDELRDGISLNVASLHSGGGDYFDVGVGSDDTISFMYDESWPTRIEVWPAQGELMVAEPEGLQEGLGILGFCYVPYHFVYDVYHPVLVQIYDDKEMFQFPVAVVIDKNMPREGLEGVGLEDESVMDSFCSDANANTNVKVSTLDRNSNPIEADIYYVCASQRCRIGQTEISGSSAVLSGKFPQCYNGKLVARADGYNDAELLLSTNEQTSANVVMDKLYDLDVEVVVGGRDVSDLAIVNFEDGLHSSSLVYPNQKSVSLSEDSYDISVQVFGDSSFQIPASVSKQCVDVPRGVLGGLFGLTKENCFDVEIPATTLDNALVAGGKLDYYFLESDLKNANKIKINVPSLPSVDSLEQVAENYNLASVSRLEVSLS